MTATIISAVCTRPPMQPFTTTYGMRTKAEFQTADGSIVPIFADASDTVFCSIRRGVQVELIHGAKGYSVGRVGEGNPQPQPCPAPAPAAQYPTPAATGGAPLFPVPSAQKHPQQVRKERAEEVAEKVRTAISTLAFCLREVQKQEIFSKLSEEGQRQMAVTAYIQSQR